MTVLRPMPKRSARSSISAPSLRAERCCRRGDRTVRVDGRSRLATARMADAGLGGLEIDAIELQRGGVGPAQVVERETHPGEKASRTCIRRRRKTPAGGMSSLRDRSARAHPAAFRQRRFTEPEKSSPTLAAARSTYIAQMARSATPTQWRRATIRIPRGTVGSTSDQMRHSAGIERVFVLPWLRRTSVNREEVRYD
jgi:hypothetical protein